MSFSSGLGFCYDRTGLTQTLLCEGISLNELLLSPYQIAANQQAEVSFGGIPAVHSQFRQGFYSHSHHTSIIDGPDHLSNPQLLPVSGTDSSAFNLALKP